MGEEKCVTEYIYGNELRTFSFLLEIKWKTFVKLLKVCINKYTYIKKLYSSFKAHLFGLIYSVAFKENINF